MFSAHFLPAAIYGKTNLRRPAPRHQTQSAHGLHPGARRAAHQVGLSGQLPSMQLLLFPPVIEQWTLLRGGLCELFR